MGARSVTIIEVPGGLFTHWQLMIALVACSGRSYPMPRRWISDAARRNRGGHQRLFFSSPWDMEFGRIYRFNGQKNHKANPDRPIGKRCGSGRLDNGLNRMHLAPGDVICVYVSHAGKYQTAENCKNLLRPPSLKTLINIHNT